MLALRISYLWSNIDDCDHKFCMGTLWITNSAYCAGCKNVWQGWTSIVNPLIMVLMSKTDGFWSSRWLLFTKYSLGLGTLHAGLPRFWRNSWYIKSNYWFLRHSCFYHASLLFLQQYDVHQIKWSEWRMRTQMWTIGRVKKKEYF